MLDKETVDRQMQLYRKHATDYDNNFRKKGIIPKNHDWRPYRWCSRDIVFALLVVKHERARNCLLVDVCAMANPPQYYRNSGAKLATSYLLAEAYKCGTSMEIVFTENVETRLVDGVKKGRVPQYIYFMARDFGIKLTHALEGHISPFESRQLYMKLVGFSKKVQEKIMQLSVEGKVSPERVCFVVTSNTWTVAEAESLILGSKHPESVLLSASEPEDRQLYLGDIIDARGAILGGALDRKMAKKEHRENGHIVEVEDAEPDLEIDFDGRSYAKLYKVRDEKCYIPWTDNKELVLNPGELMVALIRARNSEEIREAFDIDMVSLRKTVEKYKATDPGVKCFYLVPRDFEEIPEAERTAMKQRVVDNGAVLMMAPESVASLDTSAMARIERGRMVRHE